MATRRLLRAPVAVLGALSLACDVGERSTAPSLTSPSFSVRAAPSRFYEQHNLVSDGAVPAGPVAAALVNAWGLVARSASPRWGAGHRNRPSPLLPRHTRAQGTPTAPAPGAP